MLNKSWIVAVLGALTLSGAGIVYASQPDREALEDRQEIAALQQARIGLAQAVNAAEQHVRGKAIAAELEMEKGKPVYEVEVASASQVMAVEVDTQTGNILKAVSEAEEEKAEGHADRD